MDNEELTELVIPEDITELRSWLFYGCGNIVKVKIHDQVTLMEEAAFYNCIGIKSVSLGKSITNVNDNFFIYDWKTSLTECYCYATTPPLGEIYATGKDATLYVPARCGAAYKASDLGSYFGNIIEMD